MIQKYEFPKMRHYVGFLQIGSHISILLLNLMCNVVYHKSIKNFNFRNPFNFVIDKNLIITFL